MVVRKAIDLEALALSGLLCPVLFIIIIIIITIIISIKIIVYIF